MLNLIVVFPFSIVSMTRLLTWKGGSDACAARERTRGAVETVAASSVRLLITEGARILDVVVERCMCCNCKDGLASFNASRRARQGCRVVSSRTTTRCRNNKKRRQREEQSLSKSAGGRRRTRKK